MASGDGEARGSDARHKGLETAHLLARIRLIRRVLDVGKMRVDTLEIDAGRLLQSREKSIELPGVDPMAMGAGLEFEVHARAPAAGAGQAIETLERRTGEKRQAQIRRQRGFEARERHVAEHQNVGAMTGSAQHERLFEAMHAERVSLASSGQRGDALQAVTIGVGLDHHCQFDIRAEKPTKKTQVFAVGVAIDLDPGVAAGRGRWRFRRRSSRDGDALRMRGRRGRELRDESIGGRVRACGVRACEVRAAEDAPGSDRLGAQYAGPMDRFPAASSLDLSVLALDGDHACQRPDPVTVEEPIEIRVAYGPAHARRLEAVAVTMRTPGDDRALAAGFLASEGVIQHADQLESIEIVPPELGGAPSNRVVATLGTDVAFDPVKHQRNVYAASSCGICGRSSIERIQAIASGPPRGDFCLSRRILLDLPAELIARQEGFARTGGVHAAGLFAPDGELLDLREDIGRHNAVDKVLGRRLIHRALPVSDTILMVSGRAGFELVHKALVDGVPMLAAVGAPSSLAVSLARSVGMTLVGFLRGRRFNLYTGAARVDTAGTGRC